ncbi:VOC family protein [Kribbella koreensis]|uniref:VOC family protein n=1 Tax=Kribbella koreensis TaxID=57909 RepID=A0ABN1RH90_9ACTN
MEKTLSRTETSEAVSDAGWRFVLGTLQTSVPVGSLAEAARITSLVVGTCGDDADQHLRVDVRPTRVILTLQSLAHAAATTRDIDLAHQISAAVQEAGSRTAPDTTPEAPRSVQLIELGIDALDIAAIRPFWKAALGYAPEAGADGPTDPLIDPLGQGPAIWFQQMDHPRPQRNRIHLDISVPHDEAPHRLKAALAAGGHLLSDLRAPSFWVLSDPEGNEACITTWQGRDN